MQTRALDLQGNGRWCSSTGSRRPFAAISDVGLQEIQDAPPTTLNDEDTSNAYHPFGVSDNDNINLQPTTHSGHSTVS